MKVSLVAPVCAIAALTLLCGAPSAHGDTTKDSDKDRDKNVENITLTSQNPVGTFPDVTSDLYNEQGQLVGFVALDCTVIAVNPNTTACQGAFVLDGRGAITFQSSRRVPNPPPTTPFLTAITGGTEQFCEARGQIRVERIETDPQGGLYQLKVFKGKQCPSA
ncbi:hypothetical protein [Streptomyces sp. NPDC055709]